MKSIRRARGTRRSHEGGQPQPDGAEDPSAHPLTDNVVSRVRGYPEADAYHLTRGICGSV